VLLDLELPKIDGLDVLRALRADERTRLIPIVISTSSAQDLVLGYSLGANSDVRKPSASPSLSMRSASSGCTGWRSTWPPRRDRGRHRQSIASTSISRSGVQPGHADAHLRVVADLGQCLSWSVHSTCGDGPPMES
jgi:CheY-like chemotaxis protein